MRERARGDVRGGRGRLRRSRRRYRQKHRRPVCIFQCTLYHPLPHCSIVYCAAIRLSNRDVAALRENGPLVRCNDTLEVVPHTARAGLPMVTNSPIFGAFRARALPLLHLLVHSFRRYCSSWKIRIIRRMELRTYAHLVYSSFLRLARGCTVLIFALVRTRRHLGDTIAVR